MSKTAIDVVEVVPNPDRGYASVEVFPSYVIVVYALAVPIVILTNAILCAIGKEEPSIFAICKS